MTPSSLPRSRKITQEIEGPEAFGGLMWIVVVFQWAACLDWSLSFVTVLSEGDPVLIPVVGGYWGLFGASLWLMHKRRRSFQWMFFSELYAVIPIWALTADSDAQIFGYGITSIGLIAYVFFSERSQNTFTRTMEEPPR